MKTKPRLLLVLAATLLTGSLPAAPLIPPNHIQEVTVYPDRALVLRTAETPLPAGSSVVVLEGLPCGLDENSVRATASGKDLKVLGVEVRTQYKEVQLDQKIQQRETRVKDLEKEQAALEDERSELEQQRELLNQMRGKMTTETERASKSGTVTSQNLKSLLDFYASELKRMVTRLRVIANRDEAINEEREKVDRELSDLRRPGSPETKAIFVTLDAGSAGNAAVRVSYMVGGVSWMPQYDAHAVSKDDPIQLSYYGTVRQQTGEDWTDVKMTLSTSRPSQLARMPEMQPWLVGMPEAVPMGEMRMEGNKKSISIGNGYVGGNNLTVSNSSEAPAQIQFANANPPVPAKDDSNDVAVGTIVAASDPAASAVFRIPMNVSIPSDGQPHRTNIAMTELKGSWEFVSTPKLIPAVFARAKVRNSMEAPLLPGELNTFVNGDLIGRSHLGLVSPDAKFDLALGQDDGIKITRKDKVRKEEIQGLLQKARVVKLGYTITVENFRKQEQSIEVIDQLPISQIGGVKVNVVNMSVTAAEQDKDSGKLTWKLKLGARQKQVIEVEFEVESPVAVAANI